MEMKVIEGGEEREREVDCIELRRDSTGGRRRVLMRPVLRDGEEAFYSICSDVPHIVRVRDT